MLTVQFSWINFMWIKWYFLPIYGQIYPLKYSTGPNFNILPKNFVDRYQITLPYISYFQIDQQQLANNLNFSLLFIIIPLFAMIITFCRFRKYKLAHMSIKIDEKT